MRAFAAVAATLMSLLWAAVPACPREPRIEVVAAESFYGDVAMQIAGDRARVVSVISSPDQDPHLFETSPSVLREIAQARIVVVNGANYDPWMTKLLDIVPRSVRTVVTVADLVEVKPGGNPHLWYDPNVPAAVAKALADALIAADPAYRADYSGRLQQFLASLEPMRQKIAAIAAKYGGAPVTATEPVFGYMAAALKLEMRNLRLQLAVMNDTEPGIYDIAGFEQDLERHQVRVLLYNKQATSKIVQHLVDVARASSIPVVGITETPPPGRSFQGWMLGQLEDLEKALGGPSS